MKQRHAIILAARQKSNSLQINQPEFRKVKRRRQSASVNQSLQIRKMLFPHLAD
jgi:hypothetical protein